MLLNSRSSVLILLTATVAFAACAKSNSHRPDVSSGAMGRIVATSIPGVSAKAAPATTVPKTAKVRIITEGDKQMAQYLDPAATSETQVGAWVDFAPIETVKSGAQFYHWGSQADVKTWVTTGFGNNEIEDVVKLFNDHDVEGSGFYLSQSPVDSADYGDSQLVVEPQHDISVLTTLGGNLNWQGDQESILFTNPKDAKTMLVPMSVIGAAGIDAVHYGPTWYVAIRTELLTHVFEGSWDNFLKHPPANGTMLDLLTFAGKYDLTPAAEARPELQADYPIIAHYIRSQTISPTELDSLLKPIVASFAPNQSTSSQVSGGLKALKKNSKLSGLYALIEPALITQLKAVIDTILAQHNTQSLSSALWNLDAIGVSPLRIYPKMQTFVNQVFYNWWGNLDPHSPNYTVNNSDFAQKLAQNMAFVNFYVLLDRLDSGSTTPWYEPDDLRVDRSKAPTDLIQSKFTGGQMQPTTAADGLTMLTSFAKVWSPSPQYRDTFATATGSAQVNGADKPGYLLVNESELAELELNSYITVHELKVKNPKSGELDTYVQYDYPSAANYLQFVDKLQTPNLVSQLRAADAQGQLKDHESPTFRSLTRLIVQDLAGQVSINPAFQIPGGWGFASGTEIYLRLLRLQPFADFAFNRLVLRSWLSQRATSYVSDSREIDAKISEFELEELSIQSQIIEGAPMLALAGTDPLQFKIESSYGLWAYAAGCAGPHQNPPALVAKIKETFEKPENRALVKQGQFALLRHTLHAAVADQCQ